MVVRIRITHTDLALPLCLQRKEAEVQGQTKHKVELASPSGLRGGGNEVPGAQPWRCCPGVFGVCSLQSCGPLEEACGCLQGNMQDFVVAHGDIFTYKNTAAFLVFVVATCLQGQRLALQHLSCTVAGTHMLLKSLS